MELRRPWCHLGCCPCRYELRCCPARRLDHPRAKALGGQDYAPDTIHAALMLDAQLRCAAPAQLGQHASFSRLR
eukprot:632474-Alexandrium_andersonii.AAC.1